MTVVTNQSDDVHEINMDICDDFKELEQESCSEHVDVASTPPSSGVEKKKEGVLQEEVAEDSGDISNILKSPLGGAKIASKKEIPFPESDQTLVGKNDSHHQGFEKRVKDVLQEEVAEDSGDISNILKSPLGGAKIASKKEIPFPESEQTLVGEDDTHHQGFEKRVEDVLQEGVAEDNEDISNILKTPLGGANIASNTETPLQERDQTVVAELNLEQTRINGLYTQIFSLRRAKNERLESFLKEYLSFFSQSLRDKIFLLRNRLDIMGAKVLDPEEDYSELEPDFEKIKENVREVKELCDASTCIEACNISELYDRWNIWA
ncbi:hypothetical protein GIB67_034478 [Kingdonia uniflora]|uniref:Uncharacterized protein n=1 Tax=Kingdonia uniflora TaxID=39325 RepID=A0A7J7PB12_9MAGN|nr:hypothetical protein GIB67_034478 [Kingdonia uniflora]